ncbi:class I SAM-dependent methyltransferase [Nostoc commune]|uniref:class I SAM-dependent methyltransferase n=1 Tax=Nostoc commune TaxID=1178 RepID=UPI0018C54145|nr:class I SAM-dependent methyltransferase [Nostoc commune]MBG1260301.1 class I SAM-dependent methyltransferase [Nostoc commune BAE]
MENYYNISWLEQDKLHKTSILKRLFYFFSRPLLSIYASQFLSTQTLKILQPSLVLPGRGMPLETRRLWGAALCKTREATILVQGTGTGWDVISWARLKPKKIIATDLFEFKDSWSEITNYCKKILNVEIEFYQSPLEDHSFIKDESIDLCASDAVFEHCQDLKSVLKESFRVLKPGGILYATYGPLWFCAGGDHFSGRGGLQNCFNHLLLDSEQYMKYFLSFLQTNEDFQSGGRYVELDLFSRLSSKEYCELFKEVGFQIKDLILQLDPKSLAFKTEFSEIFRQLCDKYTNKYEDDFLISANLVRLLKPSSS